MNAHVASNAIDAMASPPINWDAITRATSPTTKPVTTASQAPTNSRVTDAFDFGSLLSVTPGATHPGALPVDHRGTADQAKCREDQWRRDWPRSKVGRTVAWHWADHVSDSPGDTADRDDCPEDQHSSARQPSPSGRR